MDIEALIKDKIARLQDLNKEMQKISTQIGALQEQGRALHQAALEIRGAVNALSELKQKETEALEKSATAKLLLPEGVKPIVEDVAPTPEAPAVVAPTEEVKATDSIQLEVK